jgi:hypothetical protein
MFELSNLLKHPGRLSVLLFFAKIIPAPPVVAILLLLLATNLMMSYEGGNDRIALDFIIPRDSDGGYSNSGHQYVHPSHFLVYAITLVNIDGFE